MKWLRRIYYLLIPNYEIIEEKKVMNDEVYGVIEKTKTLSEENRWVVSPREETEPLTFTIWMCRKIRIYE